MISDSAGSEAPFSTATYKKLSVNFKRIIGNREERITFESRARIFRNTSEMGSVGDWSGVPCCPERCENVLNASVNVAESCLSSLLNIVTVSGKWNPRIFKNINK